VEHKLSCGVVVVRQTDNGWKTILLRAFHHWDFPKGIREPGEDPMQAALREVTEETGIDDLAFEWGDRFFETGPYSKGKVARYFLAQTSQEEITMGLSPETGEPEHHEWRWVSFDEAYDMGSPRVRSIVQWARQVIGA
jgi:8-oxo-dGTP pyrophosphatase MutT (NUDIX family)